MIIYTQWLNALLHKSVLFDQLIYIFAQYMLFIALGVFLLAFMPYSKVQILQVTKGLILGVFIWLVSQVFNAVTAVERPFVALGDTINPLFIHGLNDSFPSGHSVIIFTLAFYIYSINRYIGLTLILFAILSGMARVIAGVHWPTDILGSAILAYIGVVLYKYFYGKFRNRK